MLNTVRLDLSCKGLDAEFFPQINNSLNSFHRQIGRIIKEFISLVPRSRKIKFTDTKDFTR